MDHSTAVENLLTEGLRALAAESSRPVVPQIDTEGWDARDVREFLRETRLRLERGEI